MKNFHTVSWLNRMLLLSGSILIGCLLVTADAAPSVGVTVGSANGAPGTTVTILVSLSNVPTGDQAGIVGMKLILRYDPAIVHREWQLSGFLNSLRGMQTTTIALISLEMYYALPQSLANLIPNRVISCHRMHYAPHGTPISTEA